MRALLIAVSLVAFAALAQGVGPLTDPTFNSITLPSTGKLCLDGSACTVPIWRDGSFNISLGSGASGNVVMTGPGFNFNSSGTIGRISSGTILIGTAGQNVTAVQLGSKTLWYAPERLGSYQTITNADTAFTAVGMTAPTLLNGTAGTADTSDTAYQMVKYTTSAVSGNAVSISGPFTTTQATYLPLLYAVARTDPSAVTSVRYYVGLGASSLDQVATLAGANAVKGCWFRFDTGIGDTDWMAESSDGTTASATDTTVAVASATTYTLLIDASVSGACNFWVNGALKVAKSSNINASTTALGIEASVTTLTTAAKSLSASKVILQQN